MKRLLLAASVLTLLSGASFAADLAPQAVEPVAPAYAPYSWTGFYVGLNAGGAWNDSKWSPVAGVTSFPSFNTNGSGFIYGAQAGYNYQINQFVVGLEGDFSGSTVKGDGSCAGTAARCETKQDWLASIRGRVGYAFDRLLIYGTGGVAFTQYKNRETSPISVSWGDSTRTGWTVGLGAEYAITDHITAGVEWKYYDFGDKNENANPVINPSAIKFKETEHTVIGKINYKF
ncbi:outer membrane protein [Labrys sp. LIt4]|uniref:outer membrane protein n=1 Tax=Labrys sp. LIt4 TaxID=2821355 RepID=UPI0032AFAC66